MFPLPSLVLWSHTVVSFAQRRRARVRACLDSAPCLTVKPSGASPKMTNVHDPAAQPVRRQLRGLILSIKAR
jgi:hypothetical protein